MNVECGVRNVELVGFADYIIMNYSIFNIHYCFISLREQPASQSIASASRANLQISLRSCKKNKEND
jgi:hypothetical protein